MTDQRGNLLSWPRRHARSGIATCLFASLLGCVVPASASGDEAGSSVEAIWLVQSFDFDYSSSRFVYACAPLRDKIAAILEAVGARPGVAMDIRCTGDFLQTVRARIELAAPVAATAENVRAATTFDDHAKLLARSLRVPLPTANTIERFPATWRTISLGHQRQLRLEYGDCELLRGISAQLFTKMAVRPTVKLHCIEGAVYRAPRLEVVALVRDDHALRR